MLVQTFANYFRYLVLGVADNTPFLYISESKWMYVALYLKHIKSTVKSLFS